MIQERYFKPGYASAKIYGARRVVGFKNVLKPGLCQRNIYGARRVVQSPPASEAQNLFEILRYIFAAILKISCFRESVLFYYVCS